MQLITQGSSAVLIVVNLRMDFNFPHLNEFSSSYSYHFLHLEMKIPASIFILIISIASSILNNFSVAHPRQSGDSLAENQLFEKLNRFVVWLLEKGKREYGVGTTRQLYVIIDRTPSQSKDSYFGSPSAATNLPIMKSVFSAVQVSVTLFISVLHFFTLYEFDWYYSFFSCIF